VPRFRLIGELAEGTSVLKGAVLPVLCVRAERGDGRSATVMVGGLKRWLRTDASLTYNNWLKRRRSVTWERGIYFDGVDDAVRLLAGALRCTPHAFSQLPPNRPAETECTGGRDSSGRDPSRSA
jgi:hypothetical protein